MSHKEMLKFDETFLKKHKFHTIKKPNDINDFDIDHILIWNQYFVHKFFFKYFIGDKNCSDYDITPFPVKLPKLAGSIKVLGKVKHVLLRLLCSMTK